MYSFSIVDSTNNQAKRFVKKRDDLDMVLQPTVFVSDQQTQGRGQFSRLWESALGGLYYSLLIDDCLSCEFDRSLLTIKVAESVSLITYQLTDIQPTIEWPNDLIIQNKKYGGILCERGVYSQGKHYLIIGVGLNLNQASFSDSLHVSAISLRQITGKEYNRTVFIEFITKELTSWLCEESVAQLQ